MSTRGRRAVLDSALDQQPAAQPGAQATAEH